MSFTIPAFSLVAKSLECYTGYGLKISAAKDPTRSHRQVPGLTDKKSIGNTKKKGSDL